MQSGFIHKHAAFKTFSRNVPPKPKPPAAPPNENGAEAGVAAAALEAAPPKPKAVVLDAPTVETKNTTYIKTLRCGSL